MIICLLAVALMSLVGCKKDEPVNGGENNNDTPAVVENPTIDEYTGTWNVVADVRNVAVSASLILGTVRVDTIMTIMGRPMALAIERTTDTTATVSGSFVMMGDLSFDFTTKARLTTQGLVIDTANFTGSFNAPVPEEYAGQLGDLSGMMNDDGTVDISYIGSLVIKGPIARPEYGMMWFSASLTALGCDEYLGSLHVVSFSVNAPYIDCSGSQGDTKTASAAAVTLVQLFRSAKR